MKKTLSLLFVALSLFATPLVIADELIADQNCQPLCPVNPKYYASAFAALNWLHPEDNQLIKFKMGYAGAVALGTFINPDWRLEVEGSYRKNELNYVKIFAGHKIYPSLYSDTKALLANLYYEMNPCGLFRPYIGLGLGYAEVRVVFMEHYFYKKFKEGKMASQVILGVKTSLTDSVDLGLEYRYFTSKHNLFQQNVGFSLTQKF